jgi:hypothetical protein
MRTLRTLPVLVALLAAACSNNASAPDLKPGEGRMVVQLKDAPFDVAEVQSVDVFVLRVQGKLEETTDADAAADVDGSGGGWLTVAEPNVSIDLLTLSGGNVATIGQAALAAGTYKSLRLVLDVSKSSVTLKNGTQLTATSQPSIMFPSAGSSGLKINLDQPIAIDDGGTTTVLVDFDVGNSFVLRGNTIMQNGLLFKPVIRATVQ